MTHPGGHRRGVARRSVADLDRRDRAVVALAQVHRVLGLQGGLIQQRQPWIEPLSVQSGST
jgi:hypothetical protein